VLDINITPELRDEGAVRELVRMIQDLRKEKGLTIQDRVTLVLDIEEKGKDLVLKNKSNISSTTLLKDIVFKDLEGETINISGMNIKVNIEK
jgi:isoleucyl-tRNA synthetase